MEIHPVLLAMVHSVLYVVAGTNGELVFTADSDFDRAFDGELFQNTNTTLLNAYDDTVTAAAVQPSFSYNLR